MKVAVVNLTSGGFSGGYVKYLRELLPRLRAHADVTSLEVFMPPGRERDLDPPGRTWPAADARRGFPALREEIERLAPDVVFFPTTRLVATSRPTVVMLRNMEPLTEPFAGHTLIEGARNLARRWAAERACRQATRVIAVSEHVRAFVMGRWRLPPDRVGVVYHGVDTAPAARATRPAQLPALPGRWILTAGSIRPARGLADAINAWSRLPPELTLVVAGEPDPSTAGHARKLRRLAARRGVAQRIIWPGRLRPEEMAWCYANCDLFLTTTRAEACPNTGLEALSHGCSIVSTSVDPMPEFFADAAQFYPAGDATALAAAITNLLAEPPIERAARAALARQRAAIYRWDDTANRTVRELKVAAGLTPAA